MALGSRFEGIHEKHMLVRGAENRDTAWYAILDDDWPDVRSTLETPTGGRLASVDFEPSPVSGRNWSR